MPRVALLLPDGNRDLSRAIGMRLLMRHAQITGKDVVLVTRSPSIRQRARAEGQTCVASERQLQFEGSTQAPLPLGGLNLGVPARAVALPAFALVAMLFAAFCAIFWYLPVANITVYPPTEAVTADQLIMVDAQATQLNSSAFVVPAALQRTSVRRTVFVPATGAAPSDVTAAAVAHTIATADLDSGQSLAVPALREQGLADLRRQYGDSETFFPETLQAQVSNVDFGQQAGEPADFLQVTYTGSVSALAASNVDLRGLFTSLLQRNLRSDREILEPSLVLTVLHADQFDSNAGRLPVEFRAIADATSVLDTQAIANRLRGRSRSNALATILAETASVQPPLLALTPHWVPWFPRVSSHIHLTLESGGSPP